MDGGEEEGRKEDMFATKSGRLNIVALWASIPFAATADVLPSSDLSFHRIVLFCTRL